MFVILSNLFFILHMFSPCLCMLCSPGYPFLVSFVPLSLVVSFLSILSRFVSWELPLSAHSLFSFVVLLFICSPCLVVWFCSCIVLSFASLLDADVRPRHGDLRGCPQYGPQYIDVTRGIRRLYDIFGVGNAQHQWLVAVHYDSPLLFKGTSRRGIVRCSISDLQSVGQNDPPTTMGIVFGQ